MPARSWLVALCLVASGPASEGWAQKPPDPEEESFFTEEELQGGEPELDPSAPARPKPAEPAPEPPKPAPTPPPAGEEAPSPPPVDGVAAPELDANWRVGEKESDIRDRLAARSALIARGNHASAELEVLRILELKEALRISNVPLASAALVQDARAALAVGDPGRAVVVLEAAHKLSPDFTDIHWMRLRAAFDYDRLDVVGFARILSSAVLGRLSSFRNQLSLLTDLLAILGVAAALTIVLFAAVQLAKYLRYLAHDLAAFAPRWASPLAAGLALLLLALAPVALGAGVLVAAALWLGLALPYQARGERWTALGALVVLALAPTLIGAAVPLVAFHGSSTDALDRALHQAFPEADEARLAAAAKGDGSSDFDVVVALAVRAQIRGELKESVAWFQHALSIRPGDTAARNNLGCVLFRSDARAAMEQFAKAAQNGDRAEPWLNVASLLLDQSDFDGARGAIDRARAIDAALARQYGDLPTDTPTLEKLRVIPLARAALWNRVFEVDEVVAATISDELWRATGSRVPAFALTLAALLAAALGMLFALRRDRLNISGPCTKCARPASTLAPHGYCEQCQSLFLNAVDVDPGTRERKERAIGRHEALVRVRECALSIVPGVADFYATRPLIGVVTAFVFFAAAFATVWIDRLALDATRIWTGPPFVQFVFFGAAAFSVMILSIRRAFR